MYICLECVCKIWWNSIDDFKIYRKQSIQKPLRITALALTDVLGVFTPRNGFRTPKIWSSDVHWLPQKIVYARRQCPWRIHQYWEFAYLILPPTQENQECVTVVILEIIDWPIGVWRDNQGPPTIGLCWFNWQGKDITATVILMFMGACRMIIVLFTANYADHLLRVFDLYKTVYCLLMNINGRRFIR